MIKGVLRKALDWAYPKIYLRTMHNHRVAISERIYKEFGGTIKYGPFKGLILVSNLKDLSADYPAMFFGTYEQEILESLTEIPRSYSTLINLGAGDGYYAVGVLASGMFAKTIAYEGNEDRRSQITHLAEINNCKTDIQINAWADKEIFQKFGQDFLSKSVIISDIEGAEFDIFDDSNFELLKRSIIFIEIHDFLVSQGDVKLQELLQIAEKHFQVTRFTTASRNPSLFPELKYYSDQDRWFTVVEGRGQLMTWLKLDPKPGN
jgi:hypothetical protein